MHQNPYFSQNSSGDSSDSLQLPFPEPADAVQLPFPSQQSVVGGHTPVQVPFQQPLPSTETIDVGEVRFLQLLPMRVTDEMDESTQTSLEALSSSTETGEINQVSQLPFPQQPTASGTSFNVQNPPQQVPFSDAAAQQHLQVSSIGAGDQGTLAMPMPGLIQVPLVSKAMAAQEDRQPVELAPSNQQAKRAIINGVIAFFVSLLALETVAGFAGLVIGAFAMFYGFLGLRRASRLNRAGWGQAVIGIALGLLACSIVLAAIVLRAPHSR